MRITKAELQKRVDMINSARGWKDGEISSLELGGYRTVYRVEQITSKDRCTRHISPSGTVRETYSFLSGMLAAMDLTDCS